MGTVMNGKKWAGACVNGKVVSGLAKDGSVFYRKPVSTHRRRIMVGDNLKGKDIFSTIPQGFWQNYVTSTEIINNVDYDLVMFQNTNWNDYIRFYTNKNESLLPVVRLYDYGGIPNEIYSYQADINKETNNSKTTHKNDKDYIVSSIVENNVYRHLYIEDENIRPLKVGDKIVAGTKIYFNYPDNYYVQWPADGTYNDVIRVGGLGSFYHSRYSSGAMSISLDGFASFFHLSEYIYETDDNGNVSTNKSYIEFTEDEGEVTYIDTNNSYDAATKYILVDKTTLGV